MRVLRVVRVLLIAVRVLLVVTLLLLVRVLVGGGAVAEGAAFYFVHTLKISLVRALRLQPLASKGEGRGRCEGALGRYSNNLIIFFRV